MRFLLLSPVLRFSILIAALIWSFWLFKKVEPFVFPVVSDFKLTEVDQQPQQGRTLIAGQLTKERDCTFNEVIAVSNDRVVSVIFQETAYNSQGAVSRPVGSYDWGWWAILPAVTYLELYSRHECMTGEVLTKLYEGKL